MYEEEIDRERREKQLFIEKQQKLQEEIEETRRIMGSASTNKEAIIEHFTQTLNL